MSDDNGDDDKNDNGDKEDKVDEKNNIGMSEEQLRQVLVEKGWTETKAFVEPGTPTASKRNTAASRSADAERKAREREELQEKGWRQHNVMAPDDPIAREFLSAAAAAIKSKTILKALRTALADPDVVKIGRRVRRLRGEPGERVRQLLHL